MTKRVLTLALALALCCLCAAPVLAESGVTEMYVYTDNQKGLNVRSTPYVGDNIIGLAPFGTRINVLRFLDNGWACIRWNGSEAYVQSRFLQGNYPSVVTPVPATPTPVPTAVPTRVPTAAPYNNNGYNYNNNNYNYNNNGSPTGYTETMATLNAEFRTARTVTPFVIVVRPARASGWVNVRWAPSKDAEILGMYRSGARLTVLAETQSWYQVADPDTDATGFIMKAYTTRQY